MSVCTSCPRKCGADRNNSEYGFCGVGANFKIARAALHLWEEPYISGKNGSGTIFFSGCNLGCVFCQNYEISHKTFGREVTGERLKELMLRLQEKGAENINLVTPTQYSEELIPVLESVKPQLRIPIVFNCGGYESVSTLKRLEGLVDVYMPDFKYMSKDLAQKYSSAPDYPEVATEAVLEMYRQVGKPLLDDRGLLMSGLIVRHLILPGCRHDSMAVLEHLAEILPTDGFLLSLMSQYTPDFAENAPYANLHRRITQFEYQSVLQKAWDLGFEGSMQKRSSASTVYTPDFHEESF